MWITIWVLCTWAFKLIKKKASYVLCVKLINTIFTLFCKPSIKLKFHIRKWETFFITLKSNITTYV